MKGEKEIFENHLLSLPLWTEEEFERQASRIYHKLEVNFDVEGHRHAQEKIVVFRITPSYGPVLPEALFGNNEQMLRIAEERQRHARSSNEDVIWYSAYGYQAHVFLVGPAGIMDGFVFVGADPVKVRESANACYTALGPDTEATYPKPLQEDGEEVAQ